MFGIQTLLRSHKQQPIRTNNNNKHSYYMQKKKARTWIFVNMRSHVGESNTVRRVVVF